MPPAVKNVPATQWPCKAAQLPVKYFNDYQTLLKEKYIIKLKTKLIKKDNKFDHLEEKLNTIIKNNEELIEQNNKTHRMNEDLLKSNKIISFARESLNKANYKCHRR